jgi:nitronate monooxygenase
MALRTRLTELLGIRHPVLLAPMGSTAGGRLAAAVSAAGGLGLIGVGGQSGEWIDREFAAAGNQRVGCGFITWLLDQRPAALDEALSHRPAAVLLSFGDASPYLPRIRAAGIPAICQVQSLAHARTALGLGADILIAQGGEAGGHASARGAMALVPAVVDAARARGVPVVAAGGLADGRGLAAALMLGADGAMLGTRFQASEESLVDEDSKRRIVAAGGDDTVRTRVFDIGRQSAWDPQFTGRGVANAFSAAWHGREAELAASPDALAAYADALAARDHETAVVWAGECSDMIRAVEPAGAILARIVAEAEAALARRFD